MVKLLMLYKNTPIKELKSPHQEISQCHVNISKKKLFMPFLAWHDIRISAD